MLESFNIDNNINTNISISITPQKMTLWSFFLIDVLIQEIMLKESMSSRVSDFISKNLFFHLF